MAALSMAPPEPRRCGLCGGLTGLRQDAESRSVEFRFVHAEADCTAMTLARIGRLEGALDACQRELAHQDGGLRDLGQWIGLMSGIIQAGIKWIAMRDQMRATNGPIKGRAETEQLEETLRQAIAKVEVQKGVLR